MIIIIIIVTILVIIIGPCYRIQLDMTVFCCQVKKKKNFTSTVSYALTQHPHMGKHISLVA